MEKLHFFQILSYETDSIGVKL